MARKSSTAAMCLVGVGIRIVLPVAIPGARYSTGMLTGFPGRDHRVDAARLPQRHDELGRIFRRQRLAAHLPNKLGREAEAVSRLRDFAGCLRQRFSLLEAEGARDLRPIFVDRGRDGDASFGSLPDRTGRPARRAQLLPRR